MTRQADFKRRVRARMAKTGESYADRPQPAPRRPAGGGRPRSTTDGRGAARQQRRLPPTCPGPGWPRRVLYWRDVLHEGPVPAVGPEELRRIRAAFLAGRRGRPGEGAAHVRSSGTATLAAHRDGDYVLWFEADLYDQLQIIQILARLAELGVPAARITLICIGEHPGIARFGGLGELTAEQLRELPATEACAGLTPAALELATRAWAAFRAPTRTASAPSPPPAPASCASSARPSTGSAGSTRPPAMGSR